DIFVRRDMLAAKLAAASFVRCISEFNRDFLRARYPAQAGALTVVHMGLPVAAPATPALAPAPGPPRLLCVGALKPYKGHAVLLRALARLRERGVPFSCDLVGEGPLRARIAAQIAAAGLDGHVRLLGARTQDEVAALMAAAAAVVQPSVVAGDGQMEGIPVALMEAMAARKPVVASALSGIPELVEDGLSGLLVPPGDVEALAAALQRVLTEPPLAAWLGEQGRRAVVRDYELAATAGAVLAAVDRDRRPASPAWIARVAAHVPGASAGLRRVHERRDSSVAEILLPAPGGEVVLKVHRSGEGEASGPAARREFDVLARLDQHWRARTGEARFATPRPLGFDEGAGALLMSACPGEVLAERVRRLRWRRDALHEGLLADLRDTGAWLRAFQEHVPPGPGGAAALEALTRTAGADAQAARLPRAVGRRALEGLGAAVERLDGAALPTCGRHGDFWPGNVFVDEERVEVVDLEGYGPGLACE
ncbi:MAG TPA: glycosyltransferase, partial [Vicinamibacteria bacterium]|nr:glycosyltransferase [Vicinamibacteria bacterium]